MKVFLRNLGFFFFLKLFKIPLQFVFIASLMLQPGLAKYRKRSIRDIYKAPFSINPLSIKPPSGSQFFLITPPSYPLGHQLL